MTLKEEILDELQKIIIDGDYDIVHEVCKKALIVERTPVLPDMVIPELAYMILRELGYSVLIQFLESIIQRELLVENTTQEDLSRTSEILRKYEGSKIDFVDCVIAAMAERWNIKRILTVDRRHFQIFQPKHC